jgi:hypothetical protein
LYADFRYDYSDGLNAILRTVSPGGHTPPKLLFDSYTDDPTFRTWGVHFSDQDVVRAVTVDNADVEHPRIAMCASEHQSVGVNKSFATLHGRAEFEYRVESTLKPGAHIYFAMIPIQETGYGRDGVIEVGGDRQAHVSNPTSPHRLRFFVPEEHQFDHLWHVGVIDFDFRDTPTAFYSIFAPRINEGAATRNAGCLTVGRVRLYSW